MKYFIYAATIPLNNGVYTPRRNVNKKISNKPEVSTKTILFIHKQFV